MANYADKFAREIQARKHQLERFLSPEAHDEVEWKLKEGIDGYWHPLPEELPPREARAEYAVDGSTATRDFSNSASMIITQAFILGPGLAEPSLSVRFLRGNTARPILERYRSLLMRFQELRAALENLERMAGGILYLDGSLYAPLPHLLYPLQKEGEENLPLQLLKAHLDLLEGCREKDILLLALSKTSRDSFLGSTILNLPPREKTIPRQAKLRAVGLAPHVPPDVEILARWTRGRGFSTPILLGVHSLGHRREDFLSSLGRLAQPFPNRQEAERTLLRLRMAPAIAAFHVRLAPGEDTLRVDVPASLLNLPDRIEDFYARVIEPEWIHKMLRILVDGHGGHQVYNAALYVADKEVRLSREAVDGPYLSILRSLTGQRLEYDRSTRRFL